MKITFLDASTTNKGDLDFSLFGKFGEITAHDLTYPKQTIKHIGDADIIITNKVQILEEHFTACPQLKLICVLATGTDIIDLPAAASADVMVCNVPDYSSDSVAQTIFALLLELTHAVGLHHQAIRNGDWTNSPTFSFWKQPLAELADKTFLIVGMGNIGSKVANIAEAFGMKVLVSSIRGTKHHGPYSSVSLQEGLLQADVVSLHCPLTDGTRQMVNRDWLHQMKPSAYLINTARGGLVHDADLAEALEHQQIAGYAADVLSSEPPSENHPLLKAPHCILTPHYAWASTEARLRLWKTCAENIQAFLSGAPKNVIVSPH